MTAGRERYRKLPGHRRGIIHGASVWMAGDHLLAVRSWRFREEYKKLYLREIQAITVANAPRFHISSRSATIGAIWVMAWPVVIGLRAGGGISLLPYLWAIAAMLIAVWLVISAAFSCRCRVFTAVSSEELPSVYRVWTARRFLEAVEPKISEVQGVLEGPWAEAAEERKIGAVEAAVSDGVARPVVARRRGRSHTAVSDIFIGTLFAGGAAEFLTLHSPQRVTQFIWGLFLLLKIAGATAILVQHYRGILKAAMQKLAIAALLLVGGTFYVQQIAGGMAMSRRSQKDAVQIPLLNYGNPVVARVSGAANLILGCWGLGIILLSHDAGEPAAES